MVLGGRQLQRNVGAGSRDVSATRRPARGAAEDRRRARPASSGCEQRVRRLPDPGVAAAEHRDGPVAAGQQAVRAERLERDLEGRPQLLGRPVGRVDGGVEAGQLGYHVRAGGRGPQEPGPAVERLAPERRLGQVVDHDGDVRRPRRPAWRRGRDVGGRPPGRRTPARAPPAAERVAHRGRASQSGSGSSWARWRMPRKRGWAQRRSSVAGAGGSGRAAAPSRRRRR